MRIGIIGAGMIGSTLAKLWVDAGHQVRLASRHPEELKAVAERLGPRASVVITPTLIVGTYRQTEVDKRHPLVKMLESFRGDPRFDAALRRLGLPVLPR